MFQHVVNDSPNSHEITNDRKTDAALQSSTDCSEFYRCATGAFPLPGSAIARG